MQYLNTELLLTTMIIVHGEEDKRALSDCYLITFVSTIYIIKTTCLFEFLLSLLAMWSNMIREKDKSASKG